MNRLRLFLAEDEPIAMQRLRQLLADIDDIDIVGDATNGREAHARIESLRPDVLLLDIQMPERSGLDVVRSLSYQPIVIFITAYDQHAVGAFELAATDYLLKPFDGDRLRVAIERARRLYRPSDAAGDPDEDTSTDAQLEVIESTGPLTRFFVRERGQLTLVWTRDVERLEADDDYVRVVVGRQTHLVCMSLNDFMQRLDPERFVRIHRSHAVNLDFVSHLQPFDASRVVVQMKNGTKLMASRTRSRALRELAL